MSANQEHADEDAEKHVRFDLSPQASDARKPKLSQRSVPVSESKPNADSRPESQSDPVTTTTSAPVNEQPPLIVRRAAHKTPAAQAHSNRGGKSDSTAQSSTVGCSYNSNAWRAPAQIATMLSIAVYVHSIAGDIVWDDRAAIEMNRDVRGDTPVDELLVHDFWGAPMDAADSHKSYRPLTVLSFRLNHALHGLAPAGYHFVNVALHALVTCLVVRFATALFGSEPATLRDESALSAGLLFAVHPIHTEAVCCLVGRADVLCAAFSLAALMHYQQAARRHTTVTVPFVATLICIGCAALSKETGITLVGACVGHDLLVVLGLGSLLRWAAGRAVIICSRLMCGRDLARVLVSSAAESMRVPRPSFPPRAVAIVAVQRIAVLVMFAAGFMRLRLKLHGEHILYQWTLMENHVALLPFGWSKLASYAYIHAKYLQLLVWPRRGELCFDHGFDAVPAVSELWDNRLLFAAVGYIIFGVMLFYVVLRGSARHMFVFVFGAVSFLPASHIVLPVGTIVGERLLYVPSIAYCLVLGSVLAKLAAWLEVVFEPHADASTATPQGARTAALGTSWPWRIARAPLLAVLLYWSWHTVVRTTEWQSERSLFESALEVNPRSLKVLNNLGQNLLQDDPERAAHALERAIAILPTYVVATLNLGLAYHVQGHANTSELAVTTLRRCLALDPTQNKARAYLGTNLMQRWLATGGDDGKGDPSLLSSARHELQAAVNAGSTLPVAHHSLASALYYSKDLEGAMRHYQLALRWNEHARIHEPPAEIDAGKTHNMLALTLNEAGREHDAIKQYEAGIRLHPDAYELYSNFAGVLLDRGHVDKALEMYHHALSLEPTSAALANNVGFVYERHGRLHEAMASYQHALAMLPDHAQIRTNVENMRKQLARQRS